MNPPNTLTAPPSDMTEVIVSFDPEKLPPGTRLDLKANARLRRCSEPELIARILENRLGGIFKVRPRVHA